MSRFALKIYAVLLLMGVIPLIASSFLLEDALHFNDDIQEDALETIDRAKSIHRAWIRAEGARMTLLGERIAALPELTEATLDTQRVQRRLQGEVKEHPLIQRVEIVEAEAPLVAVESRARRSEDVTMPRKAWPIPGTEREAVVTFSINNEPRHLFGTLEDRQTRHRITLQMESDAPQGDSITELYQTFFFWMLAIVIVLTIGLALLITVPVTRRVARLDAATQRVAEGDLSVSIELEGRDEISRLTEHFNHMVSELHDARRRLTYLERVSAWQEVARRLAHEIKNPLTPLLLSVQQLDRTFDKFLPDRPERYRMIVDEVVDIVSEEVETLRKLVKEFSEFARLPAIDPEPTRLREYLEQYLRTSPQHDDHVEAILPPEPEPVWVRIDQSLMRRVLSNIIDNALQATEGTGREPALTLDLAHLPDDERVHVVLTDNGAGVDEEHLGRLFEPYFTTKETGTGLGLAIIRKIILDHGGDIHIQNRDDGPSGARVTVELPLSHAPSGGTTSSDPEVEGDEA